MPIQIIKSLFTKTPKLSVGSTPPMPPLDLRRLVGPTEEAAFDNPSGNFIWGPLDFSPLKPGEAYEAVFDFGCGCGRNARQLMLQKEAPKKYLGIDISKRMISWARETLSACNPNFRFEFHDVYSPNKEYAPNNTRGNRMLPFPSGDKEFTLINAHSVYTHLCPDQTEFYMKESARILSDKGIMRTTWFLFNKKFFPPMGPHLDCLYINLQDPTHAVYYDWEYILNLLHSLNLAIISVDWTKIPGFQNVIWIGKASTFKDLSAEITPPKNIIGF